MRFIVLIFCVVIGVGCHNLNTPREDEKTAKIEIGSDHGNEVQTREVDIAPIDQTSSPSPSVNLENFARDLDQAAESIEKGDTPKAILHLKQYLKKNDDQFMIRSYLAELLYKNRNFAEAQYQLERYVDECQSARGTTANNLTHSITRLMEIAQAQDDAYGEHLYRGIGMLVLAYKIKQLPDNESEKDGFRERLLCKAAAELTAAIKLKPNEPRPHWYLYKTWSFLDQEQAAHKELQKTIKISRFILLPRFEQHELFEAVLADTKFNIITLK